MTAKEKDAVKKKNAITTLCDTESTRWCESETLCDTGSTRWCKNETLSDSARRKYTSLV
jgi:hypothetical protein